MPTTISILEAQPLLKGMAERYIELLAEDSMPAEFRTDELILKEGGNANRFYLIVEGRVAVESPVEDGEAVPVEILEPGDLLGYSWLFPPYYWQFDARAIMPTKAYCFHGNHLRKLCEANHELGYELMRRFAEIIYKRLQTVRRKLVEQNRH
jgi:CRP/FNR family transcriptional regulator, cyclic AMP receptor protein